MPKPPETTDADARKAEQRRRARMRGIEILAAINEELEEARTPIRFTVASRRRRVGKDGVEVWEVDVEQQSERFTLDEAMEGCRAWWPEPKGSATVLLVQSEHARIVLTKTLGQPPEKGGVLLVYPAPFLEALRDLYSRPDMAVEAGLKLAPKLKESPVPVPINMRSFELGRARPAQLRAVELLSYRRGFLWGPPGTGKTTTLGMLLASVLTHLPDMRVLLLSTTNAAVDQSLVAVDRALESLGRHTEAARTARFKACKRFGGRFLAATPEGRKHLLRDVDEDVLAELIAHESARPPKDDTPALAAWTLRRDELRSVIAQRWREQVARVRLVAMTTTGVAYAFDAIAESGKFDYVVFDEGS